MEGERGFTLIELMIVVAILAILSTLAMPSFQDRVMRAQVSEGIVLADFVKRGVEEHRQRHKRLPPDNAAAGLPPSRLIVGNHVEDVAVQDGVITITYGNRANRHLRGLKLALRPAVVKGHAMVPIAWVCGLASVPQGMEASGADTTTLQPPQLPVDCR